jgi:signal transduction histidine kinase
MKTEQQAKIPYIFFLFNTVEFFSGLFVLCNGYLIAGTIILFLLALNLILGQIYLLHLPPSLPSEDDSGKNTSLLSSDINEKILELTRSNAALTENNRILSDKIAFYEKQLLSAPVLYHCPLTSAVPVSLNKTLHAYYDQHTADFLRFGLQSSLRIDTGNFDTLLSKSAFTLICDNLLDNSLKYTPNGGTVVITLSSHENDALLIWKNSGTGISEDDTKKVFDLNFHANQIGSGTGFGLTQVKTIISDFGGSIWVRSSLESGFAIYIQIPSKQKGDAK